MQCQWRQQGLGAGGVWPVMVAVGEVLAVFIMSMYVSGRRVSARLVGACVRLYMLASPRAPA